jgi:hypothetical protein
VIVGRHELSIPEQELVHELAERKKQKLVPDPKGGKKLLRVTWWEAYEEAYKEILPRLEASHCFFSGKKEPPGKTEP